MFKNIVLNYFNGVTPLAKSLGISKGAISQWGDIIPEKNAYRIQEITNGALKVDTKLYRNKY
jgi:transcriptional repressor of cell division inhibition gene dicB